ncbi:MAG TPA: hypothetical protein VKQ32_28570 [Polyangia bacterium]|nr:hypothetical protein [Polyangia bacterium]
MRRLRSIGPLLTVALVAVSARAQIAPEGGPPVCTRCGPAPMYPTWTCADGRHEGGRGPCTRLEDGSCGWLHLVCPEDRSRDDARGACTTAECGPAPAFRTWSCPGGRGGSGAFAACKRDREGRCGWVHRPCGESRREGGRPHQFTPPPPPPAVRPSPPAPSPPPPPAPPSPSPTRSCAHLPSVDEIRTWPVVAVCSPGGGPAPAPLRRMRPLGDGTYLFSGRGGCFRGRYMRCLSK